MADYCIWNLCNSNCIMCTNPFGFRKREDTEGYSKENVLNRIRKSKSYLQSTNEDINLTGGEPTIHPDFLELLKGLREDLPDNRIAFATNGRRFFYKKFAKKLLKMNNLRMHVVVHSADPKLHDGITRSPGSFKQTIKGLENIFRYKNKTHMVELRIVLLKQNYKELDKLYEMLYSKFPGADRISTIFPEYEGRAEKNIEHIKVTFPEVRPYVEKGAEKWGHKFRRFFLYHFPLCALDSKYWHYAVRSLPPGHHELCFLRKCNDCFYKDSCLGVYKDYVEHFGQSHFKPVKDKVEGIKQDKNNYQHPIIKL